MNPSTVLSLSYMPYAQSPSYIYIPAGSSQKIAGEFKHFLTLGNRTILENAIEAGANLNYNVISTVKESQKIKSKYRRSENIQILEARDKLTDSSIYALMEGYVNNYTNSKFRTNWANLRKIKSFLDENPEFLDLTTLTIGSDSPFLSTVDLEDFIQRYNMLKEKPDIYVGLTNMEKLISLNKDLNLDMNSVDSTFTNYCITDRGFFRISNMYIMKPFKMLNAGIIGSLQKVYDHRKLSQGLTEFLGMTRGLVSLGGRVLFHPYSFTKFIKEIHTSRNHFSGNYSGSPIELEKAFQNTSRFIGLNVQGDLDCGLGPLLDIDDEASYYFFKKNYDKIKNYLQRSGE